MADSIGLYGDSDSSVSSEDTGRGKELKTGNLKRSYNMPKSTTGKKLSYKSLGECLKTAKNDADKSSCAKYFEGKKPAQTGGIGKGYKRPEDMKKSKQTHRDKRHYKTIHGRGMREA